jgi:hypothetical protein
MSEHAIASDERVSEAELLYLVHGDLARVLAESDENSENEDLNNVQERYDRNIELARKFVGLFGSILVEDALQDARSDGIEIELS